MGPEKRPTTWNHMGRAALEQADVEWKMDDLPIEGSLPKGKPW